MASLRQGLKYPRFVYKKALINVQPFAYAAAMRLRRLTSDGEIEAVAPFDSRIRYQHMPVRGRDGFLFHRDHDALDQVSGTIALHPRQIAVWTDALHARLDWCRRNGAAMRFLVIPEKHVVYRDKLPLFASVSRHRPAMQLIDALDEPLAQRTLYPIAPLQAAARIKPTYFRTDTHWNAHGAFVAYEALLDSLRDEIKINRIGEDDLVFKDRPFVGDLGVRYARERGERRDALVPDKSYELVFQNHQFGRGAVHVLESQHRERPTCVLFRDSFSNYLIPYLMHGFSRLVAVSSLSCHYDLLEQQKPDVVLFVVIERFLATFGRGQTIELPQDALGQSFEAFSGTRLIELVPGQTIFEGDFSSIVPTQPLVFGTIDEPDGAT